MKLKRVVLNPESDWSAKAAFDPKADISHAIQGRMRPGDLVEQELVDGEWVPVGRGGSDAESR
jgi:hypothetical protein